MDRPLWAQLLDLELAYMMCHTEKGYWCPLNRIPQPPPRSRCQCRAAASAVLSPSRRRRRCCRRRLHFHRHSCRCHRHCFRHHCRCRIYFFVGCCLCPRHCCHRRCLRRHCSGRTATAVAERTAKLPPTLRCRAAATVAATAAAPPFVGWLLHCFPPSDFIIACRHATVDALVAGRFRR